MVTCLYCGKEITRKSHKKGEVPKYCDIVCLNKHKKRKPANFVTYAICQYCGKSFKEISGNVNLYCSKGCSAKGNALAKTYHKQLEDETKAQLLKRYRELIDEAEAIRKEIEYSKVCKICGKHFIAKQMHYTCCSKECSRKNENRNKDKRIYKNGRPDFTITLTKVYLRDGGICQCCGKRIDFDCEPNSDDYPSIDHIIPIALGGKHQWDNVQLMCRKCNYLKGDRPHESF